MENRRQVGGGSSLDYLFGPKNTSSSSPSSSSGIFDSIFSPPSKVPAVRDHGIIGNPQLGGGQCGNPDNGPKGGKGRGGEKSCVHQSETTEPCYLSNSIYYGGQENYSSRTTTHQESQHMFKKDVGDDGGNGENTTGASRGNWWEGSVYY